ncbi:MAG: hypothetical protein ACI935_002447 [Moritella dasanensis]|jgi:hypothetical protein
MAKVRSAKQLTFIYFSIVAFAIIMIHATVLDSTLESIEKLSIQNRLLLQKESIVEKSKLAGEVRSFKIDEFTTGYFNRVTLPELVDENLYLPVDEAIEIQQGNSLGTEFFLMKLATLDKQHSFIYIVHRDPAFEMGEEEIMWTQSWQIVDLIFSAHCRFISCNAYFRQANCTNIDICATDCASFT